jgi:hypothetical protein
VARRRGVNGGQRHLTVPAATATPSTTVSAPAAA